MKQEGESMVPLSVIIPVYNTEKYLSKCLDSIINQTMRELEIICVDDGSTDSSFKILKEYADRDKRIHIVRKENGGLVSARKAGVKEASGRYIGYVDSDDWIEPQMYERLYEWAVKEHADMVSSGYLLEGNYISVHYDGIPEGLYEGNEMDYLRENAIYHSREKVVGIQGSLCCKIFLAEKFKEVQMNIPNEVSMSEDKLCILSYILTCDRISIRKEAFYHYIIRQESMVHTPDPHYLTKVNAVYHYFISLYRHPDFTQTMRLQAELYITEMLYKGINSRMGFLNKNLLWIDPLWMEEIPENSKVLLYGAGELGEKYYQQIMHNEKLDFAGCIDYGYERMRGCSFEVTPPEEWTEIEFDVVVITIKNSVKAQEISSGLCQMGIKPSKIYYFEQKELFWRFAEADGILG
ncbi:glycosyltransferase [Lachnospiraceae bacterium WCA-9-b2]|uniref:Glycosyltransferase n=1 Tax=Sporofaciens musculi TaxID=2681861 RepID=A0A7X3MEK5_9FIRM|nr:glycosyltransferase family 2 protein [Sporofaciens musculi]MXP74999.1 glycosyltransferase [Sporofaciens musculi]